MATIPTPPAIHVCPGCGRRLPREAFRAANCKWRYVTYCKECYLSEQAKIDRDRRRSKASAAKARTAPWKWLGVRTFAAGYEVGTLLQIKAELKIKT